MNKISTCDIKGNVELNNTSHNERVIRMIVIIVFFNFLKQTFYMKGRL